MRILAAEQELDVEPGTTLFALRDRLKPDADVVVHNGAAAAEDCRLACLIPGSPPFFRESQSLRATCIV